MVPLVCVGLSPLCQCARQASACNSPTLTCSRPNLTSKISSTKLSSMIDNPAQSSHTRLVCMRTVCKQPLSDNFGQSPRSTRTTKLPNSNETTDNPRTIGLCGCSGSKRHGCGRVQLLSYRIRMLPVKAVCCAERLAMDDFVIPCLSPTRLFGGDTTRASSQDTPFVHRNVKTLLSMIRRRVVNNATVARHLNAVSIPRRQSRFERAPDCVSSCVPIFIYLRCGYCGSWPVLKSRRCRWMTLASSDCCSQQSSLNWMSFCP